MSKPPNWRDHPKQTDADPDDELLERTPRDVVGDLGFDPLEFANETAESAPPIHQSINP